MTNYVKIFTHFLFYACWDTPSDNTGLWQLPNYSYNVVKYVPQWEVIFGQCNIFRVTRIKTKRREDIAIDSPLNLSQFGSQTFKLSIWFGANDIVQHFNSHMPKKKGEIEEEKIFHFIMFMRCYLSG